MALPPIASMKRGVLGMSYLYSHDYIFINQLNQPSWRGDPMGYPDECDENGYINVAGKQSAKGIFSMELMRRSEYIDGDLVVVGEGDGELQFILETFDWVSGTTGCSYTGGGGSPLIVTVQARNTNSSRHATPPWRVVVRRTGHEYLLAGFGAAINATNSDYDERGYYLKNLAMFYPDDEADWIAGKYVRTVWKDKIIAFNPSAIRFQAPNNTITNAPMYDFRNTPPMNYMVWGGTNGEANSLHNCIHYDAATFHVSNTPYYTIPAEVEGGPGDAGTPASMKHGELVTTRIGTDWSTTAGTVPATGSGDLIVSITKASQAVVTHTHARTLHVNDEVRFHNMINGMEELSWRKGPIVEIISPTQFKVDINTSAMSTYVNGGYFTIPIYLKVGTGSDRDGPENVGFPMVTWNSMDPPSVNTNTGGLYSTEGVVGAPNTAVDGGAALRDFQFDKTLINYIEAGGTVHWGVWVTSTSVGRGGASSYQSIMPPEIQCQLINELEDRIIERGLEATHGPICPWFTIPPHATHSKDPDYLEAKSFAIGMYRIFKEGTENVDPVSDRTRIIVEYGNEPFVVSGNNMNCTYGIATSLSRWGVNNFVNGTMHRLVNHMADVIAEFPDDHSSTKMLTTIATWPFGLSGPPEDPDFAGGVGVAGQADQMLFGRSDWGDCYYTDNNGGTGRVPTGASSTIYPWDDMDMPIEKIRVNSPGAYLIPHANWLASQLQPNAAAWVSNGNVRTITGVARNAHEWWTDVTISGGIPWSVGDLVIPTDIVGAIGGDGNKYFALFPGTVVAIVDADTVTINVDWGPNNVSSFVSGKLMSFKSAAQEEFVTNFNLWMSEEQDTELNGGANDGVGWASAVWQDHCDTIDNNVDVPCYVLGYEGWVELYNTTGYWSAVTGATLDQVTAFIRATLVGDSMEDHAYNYADIANSRDNTLGMPFLTMIHYTGWGFFDNTPYALANPGNPVKTPSQVEWTGINPAFAGGATWNLGLEVAPGMNSRMIWNTGDPP